MTSTSRWYERPGYSDPVALFFTVVLLAGAAGLIAAYRDYLPEYTERFILFGGFLLLIGAYGLGYHEGNKSMLRYLARKDR